MGYFRDQWLKYNGVSFLPPGEEKPDDMDNLAAEVEACRICPYGEARNRPVFGEGPLDAPLFFVGEGPGKDEDASGKPFVGRAGKLLTRILEETGIRRHRVFIGNIVKCRPFNNENPSPESVEACLPFLERQLDIINPQVIVTLGKVPGTILTGRKSIKITKEHGFLGEHMGRKLLGTFHPSFLIRPNGAAFIEAFKEDLLKAASIAGMELE